MGLFTDSVPIKCLVSLSGRGGNINGTTSTGMSNNSKTKTNTTSSTNTSTTSSSNSNNGQLLSVPVVSVSISTSSSATSIVQQHQQQQQQQQLQQLQQLQQHLTKSDKAGIMSAITSNKTTAPTNKIDNNNHHHKSPSASTSSKKGVGEGNSRGGCGGSGSMQQLSTSWEFIKLGERPIHDFNSLSDEKDEPQDLTPPRYIKISDGKISLCPPSKPTQSSSTILSSLSATSNNQTSSYDHHHNNRDQEVLIARIVELEEALCRLQEKVNNSQCSSPTLEKDLKDQLECMNRAMKSKERKAMQACRDQKILQARFTRQENLLHTMQQENKSLQQRIRQYEHCLDDVMRKVVDAIVAEDSLREEVAMLKSRVRDLEAQNAALCAKGRDEGYCTMSTGQPQPSNSHLEDLPEEPEQWLMSGSGIDIGLCGGAGSGNGEPTSCSAGDMEDWSMSQEELGVITLDDDPNDREIDWIWNSNSYLNSTMIDSQSDGISQLLQETIVYSEDEEIACIDFTRDFYKLVNIPSDSTKSLYSHVDADTDDDDDDDEDEEDKTSSDSDRNCRSNRYHNRQRQQRSHRTETSPTPSEAGQAQVASCSSTTSSCDTSTAEQISKSFVKSSVERIEKTKSLNHKLMSTTTTTTTMSPPPTETTQTTITTTATAPTTFNNTTTNITATTTATTTITNTPLTTSLSSHKLNENENENFFNNVRNSSATNSISSSFSSSSSTHIPTTTSALVNNCAAAAAAIPVVNKYPLWKRSNGWKRLGPQNKKHNFSDPLRYQYHQQQYQHQHQLQYHPSKLVSTQMTASNAVKEAVSAVAAVAAAAAIKTTAVAVAPTVAATQSKIPPPVPVRRSYAS